MKRRFQHFFVFCTVGIMLCAISALPAGAYRDSADINDDGDVNVLDLIRAKRLSAEEATYNSEFLGWLSLVLLHDYTSVVTAPTCTERGYTVHTCTVCDNAYTDYEDALGHTWSGWTTKTEATKTKAGKKERTCSVCGATETQPIPPTGGSDIYLPEVP